MPDAKKAPTYDAILAPTDYPPGKSQGAKLQALKEEFAPLLGGPRVHTRAVAGNMALLTAEGSGVALYHPDAHPEAGQERYDWLDRGDGVKYGLLTDSAKASDLSTWTPGGFTEDEKVTLSAKVGEKAKADQARYQELAAKPDRSPADDAEMKKLKRFLAVQDPQSVAQTGPATHPVQAQAVPSGTGAVTPKDAAGA